MPINFELTFTQPFLTQLDTGQPRGSADMARFITQNYVRTLRTGLPGGGTVPPTLPAPGLGSPPPPFPIPSVPVNNILTRQRAMQRILQTYFEAREVLIMQGDIKSTIKSIALLVKKAATFRRQINELIARAAEIQKQILELPLLLEEIKNALIEVLDREFSTLESLFFGLDKFRLQLTTTEFNARFSNELALISTLRNFKITLNIRDYQVLAEILNTLDYRITQLPSADDGSEEEVFKKFLAQQIQSSLRLIINVANAFVSPDQYINYFKDLANVDKKLTPVLLILYRFDTIKRKLEPAFIKLRRRIQEAILKLTSKIEQKLAEKKLQLREKLKKLANKQAGTGKKSIYAKAGKIISDFKKKYLKKIKQVRTTISDVQIIVDTAQRLITNATRFRVDLERFALVGFEEYIERTKQDVLYTLTPEASNQLVLAEMNKIYSDIGLKNPKIQQIINRVVINKAVSPFVFLDYLQQKPNDAIQVLNSFESLVRDAVTLAEKVQNLVNKKSVKNKTSFIGPPAIENPTVGDVLLLAIKHLEDQIRKLQKKISDFIAKQQAALNKTIQRIKDDIEMKLIMLVPLKSDLKDGKTKAEIIRAKKEKIKNTKNKIQTTLKTINTFTTKIIPGAATIADNLLKQNWRYTANQGPLTQLIDGVYDVKKLYIATGAERRVLDQRKNKLKDDIRSYYFGLELLLDLFINIATQMASTNFLKDFKDRLSNRLTQGYVDFYNKISQIPKLKNASLKQIIEFFEDRASFRVLEKSYIRTLLTDLEAIYFADSRAFLMQFTENPLIQKVFPNATMSMDIMLVTIFEGIRKLANNIKTELNKLYTNTVKPLFDRINEKRLKIKKDIEDWLKEHVVKRALNLDLKLMSIAFNLATRAFWTGFSWTTLNGVRYTCLNILPFKPLLAKADEGASRLVRELATNLNLQLIGMNGLVSPPPPTGIPPFPFVGYR